MAINQHTLVVRLQETVNEPLIPNGTVKQLILGKVGFSSGRLTAKPPAEATFALNNDHDRYVIDVCRYKTTQLLARIAIIRATGVYSVYVYPALGDVQLQATLTFVFN